ncbi:unnamed protein product [Linum tenue]|uniref:Uncharacterized protein n=1 Tax=Linum tenue TaxID=586396 RepID=A0AAV0KRU0_9ROSI|nr:unnamed protein product [Linum tenue]
MAPSQLNERIHPTNPSQPQILPPSFHHRSSQHHYQTSIPISPANSQLLSQNFQRISASQSELGKQISLFQIFPSCSPHNSLVNPFISQLPPPNRRFLDSIGRRTQPCQLNWALEPLQLPRFPLPAACHRSLSEIPRRPPRCCRCHRRRQRRLEILVVVGIEDLEPTFDFVELHAALPDKASCHNHTTGFVIIYQPCSSRTWWPGEHN